MRVLGEYLLANRWRAIILAFCIACIPLAGWLASVIVGLVTLRHGRGEGLWAILAVLAGYFVYAANFGLPGLLLAVFVCSGIFVWLFAELLRRHVTWTYILQLLILLGAVFVLVAHGLTQDLAAWWYAQYVQVLQAFVSALPSGADTAQTIELVNTIKQSGQLEIMAKVSTGSFVSAALMGSAVNLMLARAWQASLYNPGGFDKEFYAFRLGYIPAVLLVLCSVAVALDFGMAWDLLPIFAMPFVLVGLGLVHCLSSRTNNKVIYLLIFYVFLFLLYPTSFLMLIAVGFFDSVFDFRKRMPNHNK